MANALADLFLLGLRALFSDLDLDTRLDWRVTALGKVDLGEKLTCSSCGARFYDLNKTPALCPKCGAENQRPKPPKSKKLGASPKPEKVTPKPAAAVEGEDADELEDIEDDDDDDLINDDEDLDDEDDDVEGVIGPIGPAADPEV